MDVLERCYPDLEAKERADAIRPLTRVVRAQLSTAAVPADPTSEVADPYSGVEGAPEDYPFQRIVRRLLPVSGSPLPDFGQICGHPEGLDAEWRQYLEYRLREIWIRPLVVAVNQARMAGRLRGDDPGSRYEDFVTRVCAAADAMKSVERLAGVTFAVARLLTTSTLSQQVVFGSELVSRLLADRDAIASAFGVGADDDAISLGLSAGDGHNGGRAVAIIRFASGRHVVYKPRDISCETAWTELAARCNATFGTSLGALETLPRDGWGWVQFVESEPVSNPAEFMRSCGELAAVLFLLDARDMHFENVVSTARGPIPIDLETLLHPDRIDADAAGSANDALQRSVYGVGLLPLTLLGPASEADHVDLGFLGGHEAGTSPLRSLHFSDAFTDRIAVRLQAGAVSTRHSVFGQLDRGGVLQLGRSMAGGFRATIDALMADRPAWAGLVESVLGDVRVRYVHSATMFYGQILRATSGAEALHDSGLYEALTARVALSTGRAGRELVASEVAQLALRDVPYFTVHSRDTAVRDAAGRPTGATVSVAPLERALEKGERLDATVVQEQIQLINCAFSAQFPDSHLGADPAPARAPDVQRPGGGGSVDLAVRLASGLVRTSKPDRTDELPSTWIGPLASAVADRPWPPGVLGYDLYSGRFGPALALAGAARVLDSRDSRVLVDQIFSATVGMLDEWRDEPRVLRPAGWSAYTGNPGVLFALHAAGVLLENPDWCRASQDSVGLVAEQIADDPLGPPGEEFDETPVDVIHGLAGALSALLAVGGPHRAAVAADLVSRIVDRPIPDAVAGQSGYGHGIAGVASSLARATAYLEPPLRDRAVGRIHELTDRLGAFFVRATGDWTTRLRGDRVHATGWCHGSAGIALALADCVDAGVANVAAERALAAAVESVQRAGFGRNLTWCHGDVGNHDILRRIVAARLSPNLDLDRVEDTVLHPRVVEAKLDDSASRYAQTGSLMVGKAGVLLHLVHRVDPAVHVSPLRFSVGVAG